MHHRLKVISIIDCIIRWFGQSVIWGFNNLRIWVNMLLINPLQWLCSFLFFFFLVTLRSIFLMGCSTRPTTITGPTYRTRLGYMWTLLSITVVCIDGCLKTEHCNLDLLPLNYCGCSCYWASIGVCAACVTFPIVIHSPNLPLLWQ